MNIINYRFQIYNNFVANFFKINNAKYTLTLKPKIAISTHSKFPIKEIFFNVNPLKYDNNPYPPIAAVLTWGKWVTWGTGNPLI